MLAKCAKCKTNGVYYEVSVVGEVNKCYKCGFSHTPNTVRQSIERQVTGKNDIYGIGNARAQLKGENEDD